VAENAKVVKHRIRALRQKERHFLTVLAGDLSKEDRIRYSEDFAETLRSLKKCAEELENLKSKS
jgi:hypothetical protein